MKTNYNSIGIADNSTTDDSFTKYNNDDNSIVEDSNTETDSVDSKDFCGVNFEDVAIEIVTSFLTLQICKVTVLLLLDRELYCLELTRDYVTTLTDYKGWVATKVG